MTNPLHNRRAISDDGILKHISTDDKCFIEELLKTDSGNYGLLKSPTNSSKENTLDPEVLSLLVDIAPTFLAQPGECKTQTRLFLKDLFDPVKEEAGSWALESKVASAKHTVLSVLTVFPRGFLLFLQ